MKKDKDLESMLSYSYHKKISKLLIANWYPFEPRICILININKIL